MTKFQRAVAGYDLQTLAWSEHSYLSYLGNDIDPHYWLSMRFLIGGWSLSWKDSYVFNTPFNGDSWR